MNKNYFAAMMIVIGCGSENPEFRDPVGGTCVAGQQVECPCPGEEDGVQVCREDGTGFDACSCVNSSNVTGSGGEGQGGGGAGGENNVGGDSGSSTNSTSASSSSGTTCTPTITCGSLQAECGTFTDDCGKEVTCPNNCKGFNSCEGAGEQFKCGCTPKTCEDLGFNCGEADDGCGGKIQCGDCDSEYNLCGGVNQNSDGSQSEGKPNFCGNGCSPYKTDLCQATSPGKQTYVCYTVGTSPPKENCVPRDNVTPNNVWCCN